MRSPRPRPTSAEGPMRLLRLQQVATMLDVKMRTLQGWRASGKLRVVAFSTRCVRVEQAEVERLIREARS